MQMINLLCFFIKMLNILQVAEKQNSYDFNSENITFISSEDNSEDREYLWFTFDVYLPERKLDSFCGQVFVPDQLQSG